MGVDLDLRSSSWLVGEGRLGRQEGSERGIVAVARSFAWSSEVEILSLGKPLNPSHSGSMASFTISSHSSWDRDYYFSRFKSF